MQPSGRLMLTAAGGYETVFSLTRAAFSLGRATQNDIVLNDAKASRSHARLDWRDGAWHLADLNSANGTCINGVPVQEAILQPGDVIQIGENILRLDTSAAPAVEDDLVSIESAADLEATLANATLAVTLNNTDVPRLAVFIPGGRTWEVPLNQDSLSIGRHTSNDVIIDLPQASRQHARIVRRGDGFVLLDLESTNGTWLGARKVDEHTLEGGDTFRIGPAQMVFKHAAAPDDMTVVDGFSRSSGPARRPVVFVPGIMGSQLWLGEERIWPNVRYLFTRPDLFSLPAKAKVEPRGIVNEVVIVPNLLQQEQYGRLGNYLEEALGYERGKDLLEFAYDWRLDVRESARRLAETVDAWPVQPPITIIAHSLGCLVSRYYVEKLGGKHKVGRIVLMGGPHTGVPKILANLITGLNVLPFGFLGDRLRDVVATFPTVYQIMPISACVQDQHGRTIQVLEDESWLPEERLPLLRMAREFRRELGTRSSIPAVSIFGYGLDTISRINVVRDGEGHWQKTEFVKESGDDSVPESSTVLEGSEIHPVQQHHGSLYVDNDVKMRLKLELTRR